MYSREQENKAVYQRDMERDFGVRRSTVTKLVQLMEKNGWHLTAIYNTHSHADHIGGNYVGIEAVERLGLYVQN